MVLIPLLCPHCGSDNVVKNGHFPNGKQRYVCKNPDCPCSAFISEYTYNECNPGIEEEVLQLSVNGNGTRAIARLLNISTNTVTSILKKTKNSFTLNIEIGKNMYYNIKHEYRRIRST